MKTDQAVVLMSALREECLHDVYLMQAFLNSTDVEIAALRTIIYRARALRSNPMPPNERAAHQHIKDVERRMRGTYKPRIREESRRVIKVGRLLPERGQIDNGQRR